MTREELIRYIKATRKRKRLTMGDLVERSGVSKSTVSEMERGKRDVLLGTFIQILDAMDLDLVIAPKYGYIEELREQSERMIERLSRG